MNEGYFLINSNDASGFQQLAALLRQSGTTLTCTDIEGTNNMDGTWELKITYQGEMMSSGQCVLEQSSQSPVVVTVKAVS